MQVKSRNSLLNDENRLRAAKATALRAAEEKFCWERVSSELVMSVENALNG